MFGYIKPEKEELLVKDLNLYQAVYCGLCREIKTSVSFFLSFGLSYDFVFLAIARDILTDGNPTVEKSRCPYNPFKKRAFVSSEGIRFASRISLLLIEKNIEDKRRDGDLGILSPFLWVAELYLKRKIKRLLSDSLFSAVSEDINKSLEDFSRLEKERGDLDTLSISFGEVLGKAVSAGLEGSSQRIGYSLGRSIGAWLYIADAVDDYEKDYKNKKYNPLIEQFNTPEEVQKHLREIDVSFGALAREAHLALSLTDSRDFGRIADNILSRGLGREAYRIMNRSKK